MGIAKTGVIVTCPKCKTTFNPNITNDDLENNEKIKLTCPSCNKEYELKTKELIEQITTEIRKQIAKHFR